MRLPAGLIQIKGRKGFYVNLTVPLRLRKAVGKAVIQKKAADTLEASKRVLAEEQVKAQRLFDQISAQLDPATELRDKYRIWEKEEASNPDQDADYILSAKESLDMEVDLLVKPKPHPERPWEATYTKEEERILAAAEALKHGLRHWQEWSSERELTSATVTPLVRKRWDTLLKKFVQWTGDDYPSRATKQLAAEYKRFLLTRTSRTGKPAKQSTVAKDLRDLSAFWNWSTDHGWTDYNIWKGMAKGLEGSDTPALPSRKEVEEADKKAFAEEDLKYLIQRFTGCRKQGVCGLRGIDIDIDNRIIHFVQYKHGPMVRQLKGRSSGELHVPIHSKILPLLMKAKEGMPDGPIWPEEYKASEESWGDRYADSFPDKYGFNSHDLRRIVETQFAEKNVNPYFAFHITGHRVPGTSTVTQRYVRPTADELRSVVEQIY